MKKHGPDMREATRKLKADRRVLLDLVKDCIGDSNGIIPIHELASTIPAFIAGVQHSARHLQLCCGVDFGTAQGIVIEAINEMFRDAMLRLSHEPGTGEYPVYRFEFFPESDKKRTRKQAI